MEIDRFNLRAMVFLARISSVKKFASLFCDFPSIDVLWLKTIEGKKHNILTLWYISLFWHKDSIDFIDSFPGLHLPAAVFEVGHVVALAHYHLQAVYISTELALQVGQKTAEESGVNALLEQDVLLYPASNDSIAFAQRRDYNSVELRVCLWRQPNADHILQLS